MCLRAGESEAPAIYRFRGPERRGEIGPRWDILFIALNCIRIARFGLIGPANGMVGVGENDCIGIDANGLDWNWPNGLPNGDIDADCIGISPNGSDWDRSNGL